MAESRSASHEIEVVRQLIRTVRAGQPQDPIVLAEAQERGFGALMSLEAQLQRAQRASSAGSADAQMVADVAGAELRELTVAIHELSDVLTELRDLARPADGPSRVGYGFVLPGRRMPRARRPDPGLSGPAQPTQA